MKLGIVLNKGRKGAWIEIIPYQVSAGMVVATAPPRPRMATVAVSYRKEDMEMVSRFVALAMEAGTRPDVYITDDISLMWTIPSPSCKVIETLGLMKVQAASPHLSTLEMVRFTSTATLHEESKRTFLKHYTGPREFLFRVVEPGTNPQAIGQDLGLLLPGGSVFESEMDPITF